MWGIIAQLEITVIIFRLKHFQTDVKSLFSLLKPSQSKWLVNGLIAAGILLVAFISHDEPMHLKEKLIPLTDQNMTVGLLEMMM